MRNRHRKASTTTRNGGGATSALGVGALHHRPRHLGAARNARLGPVLNGLPSVTDREPPTSAARCSCRHHNKLARGVFARPQHGDDRETATLLCPEIERKSWPIAQPLTSASRAPHWTIAGSGNSRRIGCRARCRGELLLPGDDLRQPQPGPEYRGADHDYIAQHRRNLRGGRAGQHYAGTGEVGHGRPPLIIPGWRAPWLAQPRIR